MRCSIGCLTTSGIAMAQVTQNSNLFQMLTAKDSLLFTVGFNTCEIDKSVTMKKNYKTENIINEVPTMIAREHGEIVEEAEKE